MTTLQTVKDALTKANAPHSILHHKHIHTSAEAATMRGHSLEEGMQRATKAMIIRSEGKFYQFVLPGNQKIDFKKIKTILQTQSASLANPSEVKEVIGCDIGAVPPCGTLFNIPTFVDKTVLQNEEIDFSAGTHTDSITMKTEDWIKVIKPKEVDFAAQP
jgi:Ala-tRNA(Pro) deacylase